MNPEVAILPHKPHIMKILRELGQDRAALGRSDRRTCPHLERCGSSLQDCFQCLLRQGENHTVRITDTRSGADVGELGRHDWDIWCLVFSPDGSRAVTASNDGWVKVWPWDLSSLGLARQPDLSLGGPLLGYGERAAFSPDGRRLASGSRDHTVKSWTRRGGAQILCNPDAAVPLKGVMNEGRLPFTNEGRTQPCSGFVGPRKKPAYAAIPDSLRELTIRHNKHS